MTIQRPTHVEIDLTALQHNYQMIRQGLSASFGVLAVVKADAYGHGAAEVAKVLQRLGANLLGVAIAEEGVELRDSGIAMPILVLGGPWPGQEDLIIRQNLQVTVFEAEQLQRLEQAASRAGCRCCCHLKIDTGMGRLGVLPANLETILAQFKCSDHLVVDGVMTHFAVADSESHPYTEQQLKLFLQCVQQVRDAGFSPRYIHAANSAATFSQMTDGCNLVRPGIALYGGQPFSEHALALRPVMSLRTKIAHLKTLPAGCGVSYGLHFVTKRPSVIAAIPVGYADGYNRLLSNGGSALVRGQRVAVAGTVCMDWTLLDVTDIDGVCAGDEVTLLGCDGDECVSAEQWAEQIGTISYEVFCQISKRVPRYYHTETVPSVTHNESG
ncbi:MAG: alanine racemase [Desulfobacteraceae bacterium 4572_35.2]|nr:MAG: alanine racemase [Desulfobacteraceae bacterium 4572_35.2]